MHKINLSPSCLIKAIIIGDTNSIAKNVEVIYFRAIVIIHTSSYWVDNVVYTS
jgi:hypothetical protein